MGVFHNPYKGIYGHMAIFAHNANGPNFLTVHDNTIDWDFLPMFIVVWDCDKNI